MRNLYSLIFAVSGVLVACNDTHHATPDEPAPDGPPPDGPPPDMSPASTTIAITTGRPAVLVAFRDGVNAPWQPATMKTPTSFEAQVHGPYMVSVVCDDVITNPGGSFDSWDTWQTGRTLDDPHAYAACDVPPTEHAITGHMVQAGRVTLGDSFDTSSTDGWDFTLSAVNGSYDLIATTSNGIVVQRGIAVGGDLALAQPIDVAQQGTAFVTSAFSVTNAMPGETVRAAAFLETGTNSFPAVLYSGSPTAVTIAPDTALLASDSQTVSLRTSSATPNGTAVRALRRQFRAGGDTSYTLPSTVGDPQWTIAGTTAEVSWTLLPVIGDLSEIITGSTSGGTNANYQFDMTTNFVAATAPTRALIDTDIPGYQPEWRVDPTMGYFRQLIVQRIVDSVVTSLQISEMIAPGPIAAQTTPHLARVPRAGRPVRW